MKFFAAVSATLAALGASQQFGCTGGDIQACKESCRLSNVPVVGPYCEVQCERRCEDTYTDPIQTDDGPVRGFVRDGVAVHYGVRFAASPTGNLRFAPPQRPEPWSDTFDAFEVGNECAQIKILNANPGLGFSEDCLFLNVAAPVNATGLPVMFWIHGGAFQLGDAYGSIQDNIEFTQSYNPENFARINNVVVVSANHRLDIFGMLGLQEMLDEQGAGGELNLIYQDQRLALEWVQRNVHLFGGDPNSVTLFGESHGGISVCHHMASPGSAGLFHKAIVQSGGCDYRTWLVYPKEFYLDFNLKYADAKGCPPNSPGGVLACLRGKSTGDLMNPVGGFTGGLGWINPDWPYGPRDTPDPSVVDARDPRFSPALFWGPVIDETPTGSPVEPTEAFKSGNFNRVPLMAGHTRDEGNLFVKAIPLVVPGLDAFPILRPWDWDDASYRFALAHFFEFADDTDAVVERIYQEYNPADYEGTVGIRDMFVPPEFYAFAAVISEAIFICSADRALSAVASHGVDTWGYEFNHELGEDNWLYEAQGVYHAAELRFMWNNLDPDAPEVNKEIANTMGVYWSNFAKYGDPNGSGNELNWPKFRTVASSPPMDCPYDGGLQECIQDCPTAFPDVYAECIDTCIAACSPTTARELLTERVIMNLRKTAPGQDIVTDGEDRMSQKCAFWETVPPVHVSRVR